MTEVTTLVATGRINYGKDGTVEPGTFFEPRTEQERKELLDLEIARELEEAEVLVYSAMKSSGAAAPVQSAPVEPVVEKVGDDLEDKTVPELKALAEAEQIELGDATKKADIIAAIRAARQGGEELL